jgi:cobalt transporter subunit CbtB
MMTKTTIKAMAQPAAKVQTSLMSILFVATLGMGSVFLVGLAQSQTLHDAAHDVRHATGFACH